MAGVVTRLWASFVTLSTPMWIFSPEVPLVVLLGGRRGVDDGGVDNGTLGEPHTPGFKVGVDLPEDHLAKVMGLEKVAELEGRTEVGP